MTEAGAIGSLVSLPGLHSVALLQTDPLFDQRSARKYVDNVVPDARFVFDRRSVTVPVPSNSNSIVSVVDLVVFATLLPSRPISKLNFKTDKQMTDKGSSTKDEKILNNIE